MGVVHLVATGQTYRLVANPGESLLEVLRRNNIPVQGTWLLDKDQRFVSLTAALGVDDEVYAYSLRNVDFGHVMPQYEFLTSSDPVTELIRPVASPERLALVQYSRAEAMDYIFDSVNAAVSSYRSSLKDDAQDRPIQVGLSSGGDGRVLAECLRRYWDENPDVSFQCVITGTGFEDDREHIDNAASIADRFGLPYRAFGARDAASRLGYGGDLKDISIRYREDFPADAPEVLLTYWVQQLNFAVARDAGVRAIIMGYNQEDVIAERLFHLLTGSMLPSYPIRRLDEFDIIAPLYRVPKKMLDAMDVQNSLRNYSVRLPPTSYMRSSLYRLSYLISEQFPALADVLSSGPLAPEDPDRIQAWLERR